MQVKYSYAYDGYFVQTKGRVRWHYEPLEFWFKKYYTKSGILKKNRKRYCQTYK